MEDETAQGEDGLDVGDEAAAKNAGRKRPT